MEVCRNTVGESHLGFWREFWQSSATYYLHRLDLRPSLDELYQGFHKDCIRRKISRAERESLTYERAEANR